MKLSLGKRGNAAVAKPRATGNGPAGVSVFRTALWLFLLSAGLMLAVIWLAHLSADEERQLSQAHQSQAVTNGLAAALRSSVEREQAQLETLASDPILVAEAMDMGTLPDGVSQGFPGALRVAALPRGFDLSDPLANPPTGYALLAMLRSVEAKGRAVPPEAHRLAGDQVHVHFVQPLMHEGVVAAHLVVSYPSDWLQDKLRLPAPGGGLVVEQMDDEGQRSQVFTIGSMGTGASSMHQARVQGTAWTLRSDTEMPVRSFEPLQNTLLLSVVGAALLILGMLIWLLFAALSRHLRADAMIWRGIVMDTAGRRVKADYPLRLRELRHPLDSLLQALHDMAQGAFSASNHAGDPEPEDPDINIAPDGRDLSGKSVARAPLPDLKDSLSGLLVEEDHQPQEPDHEPNQTPSHAGAASQNQAPDQTSPFQQNKDVVMTTVEKTLFRAYDIRGVVSHEPGKGLSVDVVRLIGRAIGSEAAARGQDRVVVGRDGRLSSPELAAALIQGLRASGRDVIDIGQVPTPVMYFATYNLRTGSGVVVTGSHNPPDYNGLKIMLGGDTLSGEAITALHQRIVDEDFVGGEGGLEQRDVVPAYLARISNDITLHRPLRVVVDSGNGVAGEIGPRLLRELGCEVEELFCDIDGTFPNHHPDPSDPHNLEDLILAVTTSGADVGLAFDGDGDRLGVVDASGKIIWPDRQMMLYAMDILARAPGSDIIFDVKCSAHLARIINDHAGVPVMWRTGHSLIKAKLKETGAPLAGEMSGHIFFNDRWDGFDDGIYTAARLLEILAMDGRSSTEIFAELPETVSTPELKIHLEEGEPPELIRKLVGKAEFPQARLTTIDGLRVDFPDGWGLVRASNTTPCLVLRFEADDQAGLDRIKQAFRELLEQVRPGLNTDF